jgi:hypothetical protein
VLRHPRAGRHARATGIHTARQDSTPLIMLVGQVARDERGRESFQELDYEAVFGPMAKWAFELDDPERIPEVLARAYTEATSGRPGPVVLALPEDVLAAEVEVDDAPRYRAVRPAPSAEALEELGALLEASERPFVLVGGGPWDAGAAEAFTRWAVAAGCGRRDLPAPGRRRQPVPELRRRRRDRRQPRSSPSGSATATCCSRSALGWPRSRRRATRCPPRRSRRSRSSTSTPTPASSAACTSRRCRC